MILLILIIVNERSFLLHLVSIAKFANTKLILSIDDNAVSWNMAIKKVPDCQCYYIIVVSILVLEILSVPHRNLVKL